MDNAQINIRSELIKIFLSRIEEKEPTKEVLIKSEQLCKKNITDKDILEISKKIVELKKEYIQGIKTENEAVEGIAGILLLLTE